MTEIGRAAASKCAGGGAVPPANPVARENAPNHLI